MRVALAQFNPVIGALAHNAQRIVQIVRACARNDSNSVLEPGADLIVFPELALCGYPPKDLLLQHGFVRDCLYYARQIASQIPSGVKVVLGSPVPVRSNLSETQALDPFSHGGIGNALLVLENTADPARRISHCYHKRLLPTYDVFDEDRYFISGNLPVVIAVRGVLVGLSVCEDLWRGQDVGFADRYMNRADPLEELIAAGAKVVVNPSASPFVLGKGERHRQLLQAHARKHHVHILAVNQVGGNDELVFNGHSAAYAPSGELIAAGPGFVEAVTFVDISDSQSLSSEGISDPLLSTPQEQLLFSALVLGVRDYCSKTGFRKAVLGLSGGIDSAVTAVIATAALGSENVLGIALPSKFSSPGSIADAQALATNLGLTLETIPIQPGVDALQGAVQPLFDSRGKSGFSIAEENLQARVRGALLMALSNKLDHLLLTTGNKSELAVGYCTLYGDMNGGLAVLSDVSKQWVYRLAHWINAHAQADLVNLPLVEGFGSLSAPLIPANSISKPPSAELRPNQTDQDSLPPYEVLDEIIERYVERRQCPTEISEETGFDPAVVARCVRLIDLSEYKRKQAAIGLKVTSRAFGSGRRMPIAQGYKSL